MKENEPTGKDKPALNKLRGGELGNLVGAVRSSTASSLGLSMTKFAEYEHTLKKKLRRQGLTRNEINHKIGEAYRQLAYNSGELIPERVFMLYSSVRTNFTQRFDTSKDKTSLSREVYLNDSIVLWLQDEHGGNAKELYDKISKCYKEGQIIGSEGRNLLSLLYQAYRIMRTHPGVTTNALLIK